MWSLSSQIRKKSCAKGKGKFFPSSSQSSGKNLPNIHLPLTTMQLNEMSTSTRNIFQQFDNNKQLQQQIHLNLLRTFKTKPEKNDIKLNKTAKASKYATPMSKSRAAALKAAASASEEKISNKKKAFSKKKTKRILALMFVALASIYIYNHYIDPVVEEEVEQCDVVQPPVTEFEHPLNNSSYFYTSYFYVKRMCQLVNAFLPIIGYSIFCYLTGGVDDDRRARILDILVSCLENAGCSFLKFGQWLSMRPDIFPLDVINALARLRDDAPSHPFYQTVETIEAEFGRPIHEVFEVFPETPIASGSIAQVYQCVLTEEYARLADMRDVNGDLVRKVAVKVRHPSVMDETWIDVDLIYGVIAFHPKLCIPFSKEEFRNMMQNQIDFRWEAHYLSRFAHNFSEEIHQKYIDFPRVSKNMVMTSVLVESWADGRSVAEIFTEVGDLFRPINEAAKLSERVIDTKKDDLDTYLLKKAKSVGKFMKDSAENAVFTFLQNLGFDMDKLYKSRHLRVGEDVYEYDNTVSVEENNIRAKKKVLAFTLFDMYLKMFLRDNLIHGDLHAGNVLFNVNNHIATVLDAGMTVTLQDDIMSSFGYFLKAICEGDADALINYIETFEVNMPQFSKGSGNGRLRNDPIVKKAFSTSIHDIFERFYKKSIYGSEIPEQVSIGDVVGQVMLALEKEKLEIRGDVASAILSMSVIEGMLRQLDPDLDIIIKSMSYFMKYKQFTDYDFGSIIRPETTK